MVLGHDLIPHHHHDAIVDEYAELRTQNHDHHHHAPEHHHHEADSHHDNEQDTAGDNHQHNFPYHQHFSAHGNFDYARFSLKQNTSVSEVLSAVVYLTPHPFISAKPPEAVETHFADNPFPLKSKFEPGAVSLRGPPAIS